MRDTVSLPDRVAWECRCWHNIGIAWKRAEYSSSLAARRDRSYIRYILCVKRHDSGLGGRTDVLGEVKTMQPSKTSYQKGNCQVNKPVDLHSTTRGEPPASIIDRKYALVHHAPEVVGEGTNGQVGPFEAALGEFYTGNICVLPIVAGAFGKVNEDASLLEQDGMDGIWTFTGLKAHQYDVAWGGPGGSPAPPAPLCTVSKVNHEQQQLSVSLQTGAAPGLGASGRVYPRLRFGFGSSVL
ncbi:hypothetical protein THAOC_31420, partial [Thalassiosira oceanica]